MKIKSIYLSIAGRAPENEIRKDAWIAVVYEGCMDLLQAGDIGRTALELYRNRVVVARQGVPSYRVWDDGRVTLNMLIDTGPLITHNTVIEEDVVKKYEKVYWANVFPGSIRIIEKWEWQYAKRNS